jgi:hypothetical protein
LRLLTFGTVHVEWEPTDNRTDVLFVDELRQTGTIPAAIGAADDGQGPDNQSKRITDCDTYTRLPYVQRKQFAFGRNHSPEIAPSYSTRT